MPMMNPKNFALTMGATDLGLGQTLQEQLNDEEERRKRLDQMKNSPAQFGDSTLQTAAMQLFSGAK